MSDARKRKREEALTTDEMARLFERLPPRAPEAEMTLLGGMILAGGGDVNIIGEVMQIVRSPSDFDKPAHQQIYQAIIELYDLHKAVDAVLLIQSLRQKGVLEAVGGADYIVELAEAVPVAESAPYYARQVRDSAQRRALIRVAGGILKRAYESAEAAKELTDQAERDIFEIAQPDGETEARHLMELVQEAYDQLEKRFEEGTYLTGLDTGFRRLNDVLSGLQKSEMIILAARPSMGKAQPLDTSVLTRYGWKPMGELRVGDELASVDGAPSKVQGIYPQGERPVYRVTFADGRSTEACDEHLWTIHHRDWDQPRTVSTARLRQMLQQVRYRHRLWIEPFNGEFGSDHGLPLDPWLLGLLIGDGLLNGSSVRFACADQRMIARVGEAAGPAMQTVHAGQHDDRITQVGGVQRPGLQGAQPNPINRALSELGLWGKHAHDKFIPAVYKQATRQSRRALLSGLLDSDGWVESWGSIRFATASEQLAADVVDLARSLGGCASYHHKSPHYTYRGASLSGRPGYVCNIQLADAADLFTLPSKQTRLGLGRVRQRRLNVVSIEPSRTTQTQCIAVSHPARLYVTEDYIVTHNTAFALNLAEHLAINMHKPIAFFSLEMSKQQLASRLLSSRAGIDGQRMRSNRLHTEEFKKLQAVVAETYDAPMYIDDTPGLSVLDLRAKARRLADKHTIEAIFIDYMQLMSSPGAESRQQEVSEISRGIKALARELKVPVVALSQLNRNPAGRSDNRPLLSDLRESGSIEQDADVVMMLHREEYYHKDEQWAEDNPEKVGLTELIIAKQRNGPTGIVEFQFDSGTTSFHDRAPAGAEASYAAAGAPADTGGYEGSYEEPPF